MMDLITGVNPAIPIVALFAVCTNALILLAIWLKGHPPSKDDNPAVTGSDGRYDPYAAIAFAIKHIEDHYDRLEFLKAWHEGDLSEYHDFIEFAQERKAEK